MLTQEKSLHWATKSFLVLFIVVAIAFAVTWTALNFYPGLALLPAARTARISPYCSQWEAVRDAAIRLEQVKYEREILAHSQLLKTEAGLKLWSTPEGTYWVPDSSDEILSILLAQQRRKIYGDASHGGVKAGDIVLDCGAHIGTYVKTALDAGAKKVIAIEPSPEALECLRRNFQKETESGRVLIYPKGVWDEEKRLVFFANGNGAAGDSFVERGANGREIANIPVTTIDKIVAELHLARVDIIKADIKGAGTRMVDGARETIRQYHPRIVISTEEPPEDPATIQQAVSRTGPGYRLRPGPCFYDGGEIRNETLFFEQP